MKDCKKIRDSFEEAFYGELEAGERRSFESHLADCPECAAAYAETRELLAGLQAYSRPEPDGDYWERHWQRIEDRIEAETARGRAWTNRLRDFAASLFPPLVPSWRPLLTGVALIAIGIVIGRTFLSESGGVNPPLQTAAVPQTAQEMRGYTRAADYFGRAKLVLLGIVNYDTETAPPLRASLDRQVKLSRDLVNEIPVLKTELDPRRDAVLLELISELETVLLQTANLGDNYNAVDIRLIQQGTEKKVLLFKIDVGESILSAEIDTLRAGTVRNKRSARKTGGSLL